MLCFLTEEQKEKIKAGVHEYTDQDVHELSGLASSLSALCYVMTMFYLNGKGHEVAGLEASLFEIMSALIKPIDEFLSEGAPKQKKP